MLKEEAFLVRGWTPAEETLRTAGDRAVAADADKVRTAAVDDAPVDVLRQALADAHADLLVVGNKALNTLSGRLLGSVPSDVARRSGVDVLIVHTYLSMPGTDGRAGGWLARLGRLLGSTAVRHLTGYAPARRGAGGDRPRRPSPLHPPRAGERTGIDPEEGRRQWRSLEFPAVPDDAVLVTDRDLAAETRTHPLPEAA